MNRIQAAIATTLFAALTGTSALASTVVTLPNNLDFFSTTGGFINPEVLVGFNPQPDPPGDNVTPNLTNPLDPSITQPGAGTFTILFGMKVPSGAAFNFGSPGSPTINSDGVGSLAFFVTCDGSVLRACDGSVFKVDFTIGGITPATWGAFNPQPDPPGFGAGSFVGFSFQGDPIFHWTVQEGSTDVNGVFTGSPLSFALVPEPATASILGLGLAALGFTRRRKVVR